MTDKEHNEINELKQEIIQTQKNVKKRIKATIRAVTKNAKSNYRKSGDMSNQKSKYNQNKQIS